MREPTSVESPPALDEVPILADLDDGPSEPRPANPYVTVSTRSPLANGFGTFTPVSYTHLTLPTTPYV